MPINRYEDEGIARYWNNKYGEIYHPYLHGRQQKVLDIIADLNLPTGSSCLELGTGGGQNAIKYAELGLHVHGVDSSDELLKTLIPKGWFLPVSPGTKFVTLGGMVASDVHGKNHHLEGSFGDHLISLKIKISNSEVIYCSDDFNSDLFWATIGGMGLTGIILEIKFKLKKISSYKINQEVTITQNLEEVMSLFEKYKNSTYTVAWIDCLSKGSLFGRSVFFRGEHKLSQGKISYNPKYILRIPFFFPSWILNYFSIKLFNYFYFYSNKFFTKKEVDGDSFFYPLDKISQWNKIYGKNGFIQYQFVVDKARSKAAMKEVLEAISKSGQGSFLAVLKLFGKQNIKAFNSFPIEGYTLALDFKLNKKVLQLIPILDAIILKYEGRIYRAKDSCSNPKLTNYVTAHNPKFDSIQNKRIKSHKTI